MNTIIIFCVILASFHTVKSYGYVSPYWFLRHLKDVSLNNDHDLGNIESDDLQINVGKNEETEETEELSQGRANQLDLQKFPIPITSVKPQLRFKRFIKNIYHSTKLPRWQNPLYVSFCNNFNFQIQKNYHDFTFAALEVG